VLNYWDFNWREVLIFEPPFFCLCPCQSKLVDFENVLEELELFWPEEVVCIEGEFVEAFLQEALSRREIRWMWRKWRK